MKKWNRLQKVLVTAAAAAMIMGCSDSRTDSVDLAAEEDAAAGEDAEAEGNTTVGEDAAAEENTTAGEKAEPAGAAESGGIGTGSTEGDEEGQAEEKDGMAVILEESAKDAQVDFPALKEVNPEIFAWLYIPDTSVDAPVAQSGESDDYYENHNIMKENDENGALYIEAANLTSMCDFNTVIHGFTEDLYRFSDPDYFDSHEQMYLYLEDNVLTYEIFAAFERENTSLIRTYDFTYLSGCEQFLKDMYGIRSMNMMIRSGWEDVTPYHFLVTLTTDTGTDPDKQFVVLAALIEDPAGKIDRAVME